MIEYPAPGSTPLDPDEMEGLVPGHVTNQGELNRAEHANIQDAVTWAIARPHAEILTDTFLRELHKRMLGDVWKWAGKYRTTVKNLGVSAEQIPVEVKNLCEDTKVWIQNKSYSWDEIGVRFHHRLVSIHPFANGNGRHARLAANLLMSTHGQKPFTWGEMTENNSIDSAGKTRDRYLSALKTADTGDYKLLLDFAKS